LKQHAVVLQFTRPAENAPLLVFSNIAICTYIHMVCWWV